MAQLVEINLLKSIVLNGAVWPKGSKLSVSEKQAQQLINSGEAEAVKKPAPIDASLKKDLK